MVAMLEGTTFLLYSGRWSSSVKARTVLSKQDHTEHSIADLLSMSVSLPTEDTRTCMVEFSEFQRMVCVYTYLTQKESHCDDSNNDGERLKDV